MKTELPLTLHEAIPYFSDAQRAHDFIAAIRWPDGRVTCNRCGGDNVLFLANAKRWKCRACKNQFSAKVGTIFEDSPLPLTKWIPALWVIVNTKNGTSSCELARMLGVTQKTAWFMLHRLRMAIQEDGTLRLQGTVEVDETFIGGKARLMNKKARARRKIVTGGTSMEPVQGLLQRGTRKRASKIVLKHLENTGIEMQNNIHEHVRFGSEVHTDEHVTYQSLSPDLYTHKVINHAVCYAKDNVHVNGLENFWSLLKRTIRGTYVSVEPFHLFRYLDEQAFRFNERKDNDLGRFMKAIVGIVGRRLTYKKLIGQTGELPPESAPACA